MVLSNLKAKNAILLKKGVYMKAAILGVILGFIGLLALSWLGVCGLVKLITLCFGWSFSWPIATGVWLIMLLIGMIFK